MCREHALVVFALAVTAAAWPSSARGQACCGATGLVIPARLRIYEDYGVGLQARQRQTYGDFGSDGAFGSTSTGDLVTEQDLFVMARVSSRLELAVLVPYVETYRRIPGRSEWGGFFGDVAVSGRYELVHGGEYRHVPALGLLAGVTAPTGRAPDQAHNLLATDAAGTGSYQGTLGLELESLLGRWFVTFDGWVALRSSRPSPGGRASFAPRLTALLSGGYVFTGQLALGAFASFSEEGAGDDTAAGASGEASRMRLVTGGLAAALPCGDSWRLQATASIDVPVAAWGRNEPAALGLGTALVRVWP
ncbi:MAG TPA: hypothetical protein VGP07_21635 [Polyangia bacterium]|jgi:hypothetical protein